MLERLAVNLVFQGEPFDSGAVLHILRHLAMRAGWVLSPEAEHRLIYATCENAAEVSAAPKDLVILSSLSVSVFLQNAVEPIPLKQDALGRWLPFPHPFAGETQPLGWIPFDIIAGIHAIQNLWYEQRTRPIKKDGWIKYQEDWWFKAGFNDPFPIVDQCFDFLQNAAAAIGWPKTNIQQQASFVSKKPLVLLLTHDVDYLPARRDNGLPRLTRALLRQSITRRHPGDAIKILKKYIQTCRQRTPYFDLDLLEKAEGRLGIRSSLQVVSARHHPADPAYQLNEPRILDTLLHLEEADWEICLHGSYNASRIPGELIAEKKLLQAVLKKKILGYRQHYLNFHPADLFKEVEEAGFSYDLSVGYNDRSGPRAGTFFPYRPYGIEMHQPYSIWEFPFVLMDTTLATSYNLPASKILPHFQSLIDGQAGCVALIWHQEQMGGLLDPDFDAAYVQLLEWALQKGFQLSPPGSMLADLDLAWEKTIEN
jgi:hypothetical protein